MRNRYELVFGPTPRDRRIAEWIDRQIAEGRNVAELVKNMLDEVILGHSVLTGKPLYGESFIAPDPDPDDKIGSALRSIED